MTGSHGLDKDARMLILEAQEFNALSVAVWIPKQTMLQLMSNIARHSIKMTTRNMLSVQEVSIFICILLTESHRCKSFFRIYYFARVSSQNDCTVL